MTTLENDPLVLAHHLPKAAHRGTSNVRLECPDFVADHSQRIPILAFRQSLGGIRQLFHADEALPKRDLLETGYLEPLSMLDGRDVVAGFEQTRLRTRVEPGCAATE